MLYSMTGWHWIEQFETETDHFKYEFVLEILPII